MTQKHDINLKGGTSADFYSYDCADPVQSSSRWKIFSRCGGQLHSWISSQLKAHENRVYELNVYRRSRVDESQTVHNKFGVCASK